MSERRNFNNLHRVLVEAQNLRRHFPVVEWIEYERLTMLAHVNMARAVDDRWKDDKRPKVTLKDIEQAEQMASGHFDYTKKYALYCAELVDRET